MVWSWRGPRKEGEVLTTVSERPSSMFQTQKPFEASVFICKMGELVALPTSSSFDGAGKMIST